MPKETVIKLLKAKNKHLNNGDDVEKTLQELIALELWAVDQNILTWQEIAKAEEVA